MSKLLDLINNNYLNYIGIALWIVLYPLLVPKRYIKDHPLILIGFAYTILILVLNILLNGGYTGDNKNTYIYYTSTQSKGLIRVNFLDTCVLIITKKFAFKCRSIKI